MGNSTKIQFFLAVAMIHPGALFAKSNYYIVKKGDTLSHIAYQNLEGRVYGRKGNLRYLAKRNPQISQIHAIAPGTRINLGVRPLLAAGALNVPSVPFAPTAPIERKPSQETAVAEDSVLGSELKLLFGQDFFRIDARDKATGGSATVVSKASPKVSAAWWLHWDKDLSFEIAMNYRQDQLTQDTTTTKRLDKTKFGRFSYRVGAMKHWNDSQHTEIFLGQSERGFLRALSATVIKMDTGVSSDVGIKHETILARKKNAQVGVEGQLAYLGPADVEGGYTSKAGYWGQAAVFLRHRRKGMMFEGRGAYTVWQQDTKFSSHEAKEIGIQLGVGWDFQ